MVFWNNFLQGLALGPLWKFLTCAIYGDVVVTTTDDGKCVAVTRQNREGKILLVIWSRGSKR